MGCGGPAAADGHGDSRRSLQAAAARVVAHHTLPGPHDGAHVRAAAARVETQHLPAGLNELQASQGPPHRHGSLQPAQCGGERARPGAQCGVARAPPGCRYSVVFRLEQMRSHARLPQRQHVGTRARAARR
eukprot:4262405-Prymnesium_polylepis.1